MAGKSETACKLTNSVPIVAVYIATSLSPCTPWISTSVAATDVFQGYGVAIPSSFFFVMDMRLTRIPLFVSCCPSTHHIDERLSNKITPQFSFSG